MLPKDIPHLVEGGDDADPLSYQNLWSNHDHILSFLRMSAALNVLSLSLPCGKGKLGKPGP